MFVEQGCSYSLLSTPYPNRNLFRLGCGCACGSAGSCGFGSGRGFQHLSHQLLGQIARSYRCCGCVRCVLDRFGRCGYGIGGGIVAGGCAGIINHLDAEYHRDILVVSIVFIRIQRTDDCCIVARSRCQSLSFESGCKRRRNVSRGQRLLIQTAPDSRQGRQEGNRAIRACCGQPRFFHIGNDVGQLLRRRAFSVYGKYQYSPLSGLLTPLSSAVIYVEDAY